MNNAEILAELNDDQKKPVRDYEGCSFIVAGPGSGKTKTVVSRTAYMINEGIDPSSILLFTFTNKAAKEIKERIARSVGSEARKITVGTYHSVCAKILRQYGEIIGLNKKFTIFDTDDSLNVLKGLVKGQDFDASDALGYISDQKNRMISASRAVQTEEQGLKDLAAVYERYQQELAKQDAVDFDDLIYYVIILMDQQPTVRAKLNDKYRYVVADEFHDSSPRDIRLIELLGGERMNICMVLDDEQSIYGFRGSDIEAVLRVRDRFPSVKTFVLEQNYRSTKKIVQAARSLIAHNKGQITKTIYTNNQEGTSVLYFEDNNADQEANRVASIVTLLTKRYQLKHQDIAVLYRMSYLSRAIEDSLIKSGIPYKMVSGTAFYARKEIKDILCYARLAYNPFDFEAFKRIVNVPKRGIGEKTIEKIRDYARNQYSRPIGYVQAAKEIELNGRAAQGIEDFISVMEDLNSNIETDTAAEFLDRIVKNTDYYKALVKNESSRSEAEDRIANVIELIEVATAFSSLEEMLNNASLDAQINEKDNEDTDRVQLMTMHASKGLEFKAVVIIGANEGISPHHKAQASKEIEEERRLFYVAMTRAEDYLFITRPKVITSRGIPQRALESRFIREIDSKCLKKYS